MGRPASAAALAAAQALAAPGCVETSRRAAPGDAVTALHDDVRGERTYRCVLRPGMAPLRLVLVGDPVENLIARVEIHRAGGVRPMQVLRDVQGEPPPRGTSSLVAEDLDGDGYLDLRVLRSWGATGNTSYAVWRWAPAVGRFRLDPTLTGLSSPQRVPGRRCVRGRANGGQAGAIYHTEELCLAGGRWVVVRSEAQAWLEARDRFVRTTRVRRPSGAMRTRTDTLTRAQVEAP